MPLESVGQEESLPRGQRLITIFEIRAPRPTFGMQNHHEDFGCFDLSIEVPRFTTLDHINKSLKFHAFQVSPL